MKLQKARLNENLQKVLTFVFLEWTIFYNEVGFSSRWGLAGKYALLHPLSFSHQSLHTSHALDPPSRDSFKYLIKV